MIQQIRRANESPMSRRAQLLATEVPDESASGGYNETEEVHTDTETDEALAESYPRAIVSLSPTATEMLLQ